MITSSYIRLLRLILVSKCLEEEDIPEVKKLISKMNIAYQSLNDMNSNINEQIEMEASVIYLIGKYNRLLLHSNSRLDTERSKLLLGVPDEIMSKKLTLVEKKAFADTDDQMIQDKEYSDELSALCSSLQFLQKSVFSRHYKLEIMSTNYRHELKSDENS